MLTRVASVCLSVLTCFVVSVLFFTFGQVLGHLGFDFEDEQGVPQGPEGKRSPTQNVSSRGTSQYLSWGGTSAMSFEVSDTSVTIITVIVCSFVERLFLMPSFSTLWPFYPPTGHG